MGKKTLFFLAWLGIFLIGLFNIVYIVVPSLIQKYVVISPFLLEISILALSVLYMLLAIYKFFSQFEKSKDYQVSTPNGMVVISSATINRTVSDVLQKNFPVAHSKVKSHNGRKGVSLDIKMDMLLQGNIQETVQKVQAKIIEEVQDKLGIQIKHMKVRLLKVQSQEELQKEEEVN